MSKLWDAIVVGGGPAGVTAAIRLARAGWDVLVVEAAIYPGAENWSGAVYFTETLADPDVLGVDELEAAPFERRVVKRGLYVTNGVAIAGAEYRNPESFRNCYTVLRPVYDHYLAERARRFGVAFLNETSACGWIRDRGRIVGVHTTRGPLYAHVVFLAEGDASELTHKEGMEEHAGRGSRGGPTFLQGVKEVIALDPAVLEQRFGVGPGEGACVEVLIRNAVVAGRPVRLNMAGFVYTNRESVSVGLVLPLENLTRFRGDYNALMEWFKALPAIARWIEGGESVSYGAKVIRGGGLREIPRLVDDGLAIGGAATGIGVDFPYPNFTGPATAMGRLFADAVIRMREQGVEPSRTNLEREYVRPLKATRYYKDVRHLADWPRYVETSETLFGRQIDATLGTLYVWTRPELGTIRKVWESARVVGTTFRGRWARSVWDLHLGSKALRLGRYFAKHLPVALPLWIVQTLWAPLPVWRRRTKGELRFEFWVHGEDAGRLPAPMRWIGRRLRSTCARAAHALYANDDRPLGAKLDRTIGIVWRRLTLWDWALAAFAVAAYALARSLQLVGGLLALPFRRDSAERRRRTFYGRWVERANEWADPTAPRAAITRPHDAKLAEITYLSEPASHIKVFFAVPEPGRIEDPSGSTLWSVCPAAVYQLDTDETGHYAVTVNHENCVKCETCWRVSPDVDWSRFGEQRLVYEVYTGADAALERILSERTGEPGPEITSDYWSIALAEATPPASTPNPADAAPAAVAAESAQALAAADAALRRVAGKAREMHETLRRGPRVLEPGQVAWLEDTADYLRVLCVEVTEALQEPAVNDALMAAGLGPHAVPLLDDLESVSRRVERHAAARRFFFADADAQQIRQHHVVGLRRMLERAAQVAGVELPAAEPSGGEDARAEHARRAAGERVRERLAAVFSRETLRRLERGGLLPEEGAALLRAIAAALAAEERWEGCARERVLGELARLDPALALLVANQLAAAVALEIADAPAELLESVRSVEMWVAPAVEEAAEPQGERWAGRIPFAPTALADRFLVRGGGRIAVVRRTGRTVRTEARSPIGLRACAVADLALEGATAVWEGAWRASADERLFRVRARDLAAIARGAGELLVERAVEHARSRVQFPDHYQDLDGRDAIAKFGAVREHLARMETHRRTLVTLVEDAAWADRAAAVEPGGDPAGLEPKLAKIAATRALGPGMDSIAYRAGQVIGGAAYSEDDVFAKLYRDSSVFPHLLRPNATLTLDIGRAIAALIRDGRPLGPLSSGIAPELEAAERRPILGDIVQRLRSAERALVEATAPALAALEEQDDETGREPIDWTLGERAVDFYVWERLLHRAHAELDAGRDAQAWVEAARLMADTVEEQLIGLEDELAWTPVRLGLGTHALELGDFPDAPPHTPIRFSYAKEIRGGRRRYASGDFLLKPTDLDRTPYTPELVFCDPDLRAYYETLLRSCRERFEEGDHDGLEFERYLERLHYIPREHIDWARQHGFFRMVIPADFGGEGRTKADYYNLCRVTRRLGDVSLALTIQANTSIGTSPILIALEQDLPAAEQELRKALDRPELVAGWRRRLERAIERARSLDADGVGPELRALEEGTRQALARSRVLRRSVFGAFLHRVADAADACSRRDAESLRHALEAAHEALNGWEERAREEVAEIPLRREAHEFFLRLIAARMISGFALTEPSAGSDTARIRTAARLTARTVHTDERGVTFFHLDEERVEGRRNVCDLRRFVFEDGKILYRYRDGAPPAEVHSHEYSYEDEEERYRYYIHDGRRVEIHDVAILRERDGRRVYEFYVLNGAKMWITNGHIAGVLSLYARTPRGPTGFMVDAHAEGYRVGKDEEKMGQRGSPTNEITLTNVRVPRECIIGIEGRGQENALETLNVGRAGLAVTSEAGLDRQLADFRAHLRRSGLAEAGWARYLLGRALEETFVVESIAFGLIALFDDPTTRSLRMESSIAKLFSTEAMHRMLEYGEPLYGIAGQTDRHRIEKERRDARVLTIYEGTNEVQRFLIWRDLVDAVAPAWTAPSDATPPAGSAFVDEVLWLNEMKRELRERVRAVHGAYGSAAWRRVLLQPVFFRLADLAAWIAAADWAIRRAHWLDSALTAPADAARREWSGMAAGSFAARARREFARHRFAFDRDWAQIYAGGRPATLRLAELALDEADEARAAGPEPGALAAPTRPLRIVVCVQEAPRLAPRPRVRDGRLAEPLYGAAPGSRRALRWALDLKRLAPDHVSVTVIAAAPARAEPVLRRALAAGVDDAWLLDTGGAAYEEHAVAAAIVGALEARGLRPDLVLAPADAPSGGLAPRLAYELGEWTWVPDATAFGVTDGNRAQVVSDAFGGTTLDVPLPVVAEITARETEPEWEFDVAGYLRALARPVRFLPMPEAGARRRETLQRPAIVVSAEDRALREAVTPERAAELLLAAVGRGSRDGGQAPAPYAGKIQPSSSRSLEWHGSVLFAAEARDAALARESVASCALAVAAAGALKLRADAVLLAPPLSEPAVRSLAAQLLAVAPFRQIAVVEDAAFESRSARAREYALSEIVTADRSAAPRALVSDPRLAIALPGLAARLREAGREVEEFHGIERFEAKRGGGTLVRAVHGRKLRAVRTWSGNEDRIHLLACVPEVEATGPAPKAGKTAPAVFRVKLAWTYDPARDPIARAAAGPPSAAPVSLANAEYVIDVGAGVGNGENLERIVEPVRRALLAAGVPHVELGASRKVTEDLNLLPSDRQIGQTGLRINPRALITLGVSGAPQHLDYIGERPLVIAFNLDPAAPIMTLNERKARPLVVPVVGDLFETVPRFVEALARAAGSRTG